MNIDRSKLYKDAKSFFSLQGSVSMYLTAAAAKEVCLMAASYQLLVARVEGGI